MWPDLAIYWTLGNFLNPLAAINLPKSPTFLGNLCKGVKLIIFLVKSFLGNFFRHLAIFFWSHGPSLTHYPLPDKSFISFCYYDVSLVNVQKQTKQSEFYCFSLSLSLSLSQFVCFYFHDSVNLHNSFCHSTITFSSLKWICFKLWCVLNCWMC